MSFLTFSHYLIGAVSCKRANVVEPMSAPFVVTVLAELSDASVSLAQIVGKQATFRAVGGQAFTAGLGARVWSGVVRQAEQVHAVGLGEGEKAVSTYRFELVPRLWLLSQRKGHRIYQHLPIPDIVDKLLGEWQIAPTWRIDRPSYPKLEYKVQYGESDFDFFARLLEEAGIAYFFQDDEEKGSVLVLADRPQSGAIRAGLPIPFVDNPGESSEKEFVTDTGWKREVRPGARTLRDYDFRGPPRLLWEQAPKIAAPESNARGSGSASRSSAPNPEDKLEQYRYTPGGFLAELGKGGDTPAADDRGVARYDALYGRGRATRDLEAFRTGSRTLTFETNAFDLQPGSLFSIDSHPHPALAVSKKLLVTRTELFAERDGDWKLRVTALPAEMPYRPALATTKPKAFGFQSATVVGPAGQEIHTDEFGRVRVQFPWDREGKNDERSSCWVRVHQGWGGLGYGMLVLPRIGQEVLVTFLEGDPEQPIVLGRAYNALEQVPYKLPLHKTRSTWKSDSSIGHGGFNEIMFEDLKSKELVWMQAQKDRERLVKNDEFITVVHDRQITVKNDLTERTEMDRRKWVGKDQDTVVKHARRERVEYDHHDKVVGKSSDQVDGASSITILEDRHEKVGGRYALKAKSQFHHVAGNNYVGEAQDITVKGPGGFLRIDAAGVTISGTLVKINEGGSPGKGLGAKPEDPKEAPGYDAVAQSDGGAPVQQKKDPPPAKTDECELKTLELECDHVPARTGGRKFKLKLPPAKGAKSPNNLYEVVGADKGHADKIKYKIEMSKPRCAKHNPKAMIVSGLPVGVPAVNETKAGDSGEVDVYWGEKSVHNVFAMLWPWNEKPVQYTFTPGACHGLSAPAVVRVYPAVEPTVFIKFQLDSEDKMDERVGERMEKAADRGYVEKRGRPAYTAWKFEFKIKLKYGARILETGAALEDKFKKLAWLNLLVKRGIDFFCECFYKYFGAKLLPMFPKVSLQYEGKFKEIEDSYRVGSEYSLLLKADPLIGIKMKFDVLEGMIHLLGVYPALKPISVGLLKIKQWAEKKGQTFEIKLTISGEIGGEIGAKKDPAVAKAGFWGAVQGKVKVALEAKASFGSKGLVGFEIGAEAGMDTGFVVGLTLGNNEKGVFLKGKFSILECKFKFAAWASGKVIWEVKESYEGEFVFWEEQDLSKGQSWYILGNA